jgi:SAM-dependent methyltransferase
MEQEWFSSWFNSPYYHTLYKNRTDDEANAFIEKLMAHLQLPKNARILDVACGKGRHSVALAKHGYNVIGIDLSSNSIEQASVFANESVTFYVHDMRRLFYSNYFDLVGNFFTSFGYFKNEHENILASRNMITAVKKDGLFIIDFVNGTTAKKNIEANKQEIQTIDETTFNIQRSYTEKHLVKTISFVNKQNVTENHEERVQVFTKSELINMFEQHGATLVQSFGNYMLEDYQEETSPRIILLFKKH